MSARYHPAVVGDRSGIDDLCGLTARRGAARDRAHHRARDSGHGRHGVESTLHAFFILRRDFCSSWSSSSL